VVWSPCVGVAVRDMQLHSDLSPENSRLRTPSLILD
jgi:hypothetical protein